MSSAPTPLALSDAAMSAVLNATAVLPPPDRNAFLVALANLLRSEAQPLGDGVVHRAIRSLQREFFRPPTGMTKEPQPHRHAVGEPIE
jgi:hypothetical protein